MNEGVRMPYLSSDSQPLTMLKFDSLGLRISATEKIKTSTNNMRNKYWDYADLDKSSHDIEE